MKKISKFFKDVFLPLLIFSSVIVIWYESYQWIQKNVLPENRGVFGDQFGAINALFSALALGGIIYTIFMQKEELALQRKELEKTRDEFKIQNETLKRQQFETTFFNLAKIQEDILNSIDYTRIKVIRKSSSSSSDIKEETIKQNFKNREVFDQIKLEYKAIYEIIKSILYPEKANMMYFKNRERFIWEVEYRFKIDSRVIIQLKKEGILSDDLSIIKQCYKYIFEHYHSKIGHYFRHLYHILKFLSENEFEEIMDIEILNESKKENLFDPSGKPVNEKLIESKYNSYADYIQSQMSSSELFLLFYNGLCFSKIKSLIDQYNFLENLALEDLLDTTHQNLYDIKFKSRKDLFDNIDKTDEDDYLIYKSI